MNLPSARTTRLLVALALTTLSLLASADTLERVRSSQTLTLGFRPDLAPFSEVDGDKARGYAIDLCLMVADRVKSELGLPDLQVRYQPLKAAAEVDACSTTVHASIEYTLVETTLVEAVSAHEQAA